MDSASSLKWGKLSTESRGEQIKKEIVSSRCFKLPFITKHKPGRILQRPSCSTIPENREGIFLFLYLSSLSLFSFHPFLYFSSFPRSYALRREEPVMIITSGIVTSELNTLQEMVTDKAVTTIFISWEIDHVFNPPQYSRLRFAGIFFTKIWNWRRYSGGIRRWRFIRMLNLF